MPESERSLEDRWFAYVMNSVDALTEKDLGVPVTYSQAAGARSFINAENIANASATIDARDKGFEHARRTFDLDWTKL